MSRAKRESASRKYRPKNVALLLVAEAPPQALDRYFYFEQVRSNDWLFRAVVKGIFGNVPSRDDKAYWLLELKRSGVYLIDASKDPFRNPGYRASFLTWCGAAASCSRSALFL